MRLPAKSLLLCLLIVTCVHADYPQPYQEQLARQLVSQPEQVLEESQALAERAAAKGNIREQLDAMILSAQALDVLDQAVTLDTLLERGIQIAESNQLNAQLAELYSLRGGYLDKRSQNAEAQQFHDLAIELATSINNERLLAESLINRARSYTDTEQEQEALADLFRAHEIFEANNDDDNLGVVYSDIAIVYGSLGQHKKSIEYHLKSSEYDDPEDRFNVVIGHINLGTEYSMDGQLDKAHDYLHRAKTLAREIDDQMSLAYTHFRLGELAEAQDDIVLAISEYLRALPAFEQQNDLLMQFNTHLSLVETHLALQDLPGAQEHLKRASGLLPHLDRPFLRLMLTRARAEVAKYNQDYRTALAAKEDQIDLLIDIHEKEQNVRLHRMQVRFDSAQKEAENMLLKEKNKLQTLAIESSHLQRNLAIAVGVLILALLSFTVLALLQQRRMRREMASLAMIDELTGAANRRQILIRAAQEFERSSRYEQPFSIAIADLDHFKRVNDSFGHKAGDVLLREFVDISKTVIRQQDDIGRLGGEEWLFIFPHTTPEQAEGILSRIRERYMQAKLPSIETTGDFTFSAGVTDLRPSDNERDDMILRADKAMYAAKDAGRDRIILDQLESD
ncbi:MAG: tetratricopeptide repeat-containing diguanylate cyclase [bacterium]